MRHTRLYFMVALLAGPVGKAAAQAPTTLARIRGAMQLPAIADSTRKHGVSEKDLDAVIAEHKRRRIPASEARDVLVATDAGLREHGPVNNFGAFVKSRLDAGLRGKALAQAIRQEHARRGIGKKSGQGTPAAAARATGSKQGAKAPTGSKASTTPTKTKGTATKSAKTTTTKGTATKSTKTNTKAKTKGRP